MNNLRSLFTVALDVGLLNQARRQIELPPVFIILIKRAIQEKRQWRPVLPQNVTYAAM
jgi:hypothetical protein